MKTKLGVALGIGVALAMVLLAWGYFSRPIRIGLIMPLETLTGNEASLFMRYYQDKHPRIGLRPVQFIIENTPLEEEQVRSAYQKLNAQGVLAIIGGNTSTDGAWLADEAAKTGVPTFGITPSSVALSGKKDAFFRLCPTNASQAKAVGLYFQKQGVKRLVLVTSQDNAIYVEPFVAAITENFTGEIIRIPFVPDEDNAQKILDANPEGIFNILPAKSVIQIIQAVREKRPDIKFGSSSWGSDEVLTLYSGPLLDGVLFFSLDKTIYGDVYKAELDEFAQMYKMKTSNASQYLVSILHLLYQAISEVGDSRDAIRAYFEVPRTYDTSYGKVAMDEYGDVMTDRIIVMETIDGAMNKKETVELK